MAVYFIQAGGLKGPVKIAGSGDPRQATREVNGRYLPRRRGPARKVAAARQRALEGAAA